MNNLDHIMIVGCSTGGPISAPYIIPKIINESSSIILVAHMWITSITRDLQNKGIEVISRKSIILPEVSSGKVYLMAYGCIDDVMKQAVEKYGKIVSGTILSGAGNDGSKGVEYIKNIGGHVFVQKEWPGGIRNAIKIMDFFLHPSLQSGFYADEMPLNAQRAVRVDYAGPLPQLTNKVREFLSRPAINYAFR